MEVWDMFGSWKLEVSVNIYVYIEFKLWENNYDM